MEQDQADLLEAVTDRSIRRALGFTGLGIGLVMLSLSFDLPLALRCGADLAGLAAVVMLVAAWRARSRDMRDSEAWTMLADLRPELVRTRRPGPEMERRLREVLRRRLLWHAERVGLLAVALWAMTLVLMAARAF